MATPHASPRLFEPESLLGRTGFRSTRLGIGDLADPAVPADELVAVLRRALDAGLNLIDTAPSYEDGLSESLVGQAIHGRREGIFVIDKIDHLDQPVAPQVESSLGRLRLESVDLFVFHGVSAPSAWNGLAAPGGGMEQLGQLVREGKARFRGVSSHHPDVLREAITSGLCDVVMFAVGPFADPRYEGEILPLAHRHGVGTVCFKAFGAGMLLADTAGYGRALEGEPSPGAARGEARVAPDRGSPRLPHLTVEECLRYTLTAGPDVVLLGLNSTAEQDEAFQAARSFRPLSPPEMEDIRRRARLAVAGKGLCWWNPVEGGLAEG